MKKFLAENRIWFAFLTLALIASIFPATGWLTKIPGDLGDARFNSIILEHVYQWMIGKVNSLWSPPFFFPFENSLAFSDNHFGSVLTYALARIIGFNRESAYLLWFVIGAILNYVSMYYVLRKFGFSKLASAFGAIIFSVSLPTAFKSAHAQLIYRFPIPLAFLYLWRFFRQGQAIAFFWMTLYLAWQFYCSIYLGLFTVYLLLTSFLGILIFGRRVFNLWLARVYIGFKKETVMKKFTIPLLAVIMAFGVVVMLRKYMIVNSYYGFTRSLEDIDPMLPRLSSYLYAPLSKIYRTFADAANFIPAIHHEHMMFIGVFAGMILLIGLIRAALFRSEIVGRVSLFSLILLFACTLYYQGFSLYHFVLLLPGVSAVRAVARVVLVMLVPMSILSALAVDYLEKFLNLHCGNRGRSILAALLLLCGGLEIYLFEFYNTPIMAWKERSENARNLVPPVYAETNILYLLQGRAKDKYLTEIDAMITAQDLGLRTLNGYSGNAPLRGWDEGRNDYACLGYESRLQSYNRYTNDSLDIGKFSERILVLSPPECRQYKSISGVLDRIPIELAKSLKLNIEYGDNGNAVLNISNKSTFTLYAKMHSGPVRVSWRIVPYHEIDRGGIGWDARIDLPDNLAPNDNVNIEFRPKPPMLRGAYFLQASMVYEGVEWFHDAGMELGEVKIIIQ